jgi:hypothetical protein
MKNTNIDHDSTHAIAMALALYHCISRETISAHDILDQEKWNEVLMEAERLLKCMGYKPQILTKDEFIHHLYDMSFNEWTDEQVS